MTASNDLNTLLIVGATGLVGSAAVRHFAQRDGWRVMTLSRRPQPFSEHIPHLSVDLRDAQACRGVAGDLSQVTHVLYTALYEKPDLIAGWTDHEQVEINRDMLANLLNLLDGSAPRLRHITLLQGTKAYGSHVGPIRVPAKERDPRLPHTIFYWAQEDLLQEREARADWTYSILRPQIILGASTSSPMNIIAALGVYAAILREQGQPLWFPGGGRYLNACSDSRLIARAVEFVGTHPIAARETYNVVNGDVLVWQDIWPSIAQHFGMEPGERKPTQLAEVMPKLEGTWQAITQKYGLQRLTMAELVQSSWQFADRNFAYGQDHPDPRVVSPIKLRQAGFADCEDTEDSILYWLGFMQAAGVLPKP